MILNSGNITLSKHYHCHQITQHAKKKNTDFINLLNFHKHTATDLHVVLPLTLEILYACVKESTTETRHITVQSGNIYACIQGRPETHGCPKQINNFRDAPGRQTILCPSKQIFFNFNSIVQSRKTFSVHTPKLWTTFKELLLCCMLSSG